MTALRTLRNAGLILCGLAIAGFALWSAAAFWYRLPGTPWLKAAAGGAMGLAGLAACISLATSARWRGIAAFAILSFGVLGWWASIKPPAIANFAADVARQAEGEFSGNILTLRNIRNFAWRTETDFSERWEERSYNMAGLQSLDLFLSTWDDSGIAHMMMSFGFADGRYLAWSVEVRRLEGSVYSPIASAFKENTLVLVAADERDVIGLRTNVRGENVSRYRLNLRPETIRTVLTQYVAEANALARQPKFYNSLTTNCTTTIVAMMRAVGATVPLDWRLILNTRLPDYAYAHDTLEEGLTLEQAKAKAPVSAKGKAEGLTERYSEAIRRP